MGKNTVYRFIMVAMVITSKARRWGLFILTLIELINSSSSSEKERRHINLTIFTIILVFLSIFCYL